jgi:excinuclease ABC subunit B
MANFGLTSPFALSGDQPQAVTKLVAGVQAGAHAQVLLGVTGSGKTFTMANLIQQTGKPTLVLAHNKTLAGQLYQELRDFFPENAVSYFVSYYDYYQPEAYIAATDTYIEKEATINDEIDKLRLSATTNLLTRPDCIVVASVSCIYNLGSPADYAKSFLEIIAGELIARESLLVRLQALQYQNSPYDLKRASFRIKGDVIQVWPANESFAWSIDTLEDRITAITKFDPHTGETLEQPTHAIMINPAKHHIVGTSVADALAQIEQDLQIRIKELKLTGKVIEAYRLEQKVKYDLEQIKEFGFVGGIENYTRYFDGRAPGAPPFTLLDYFWENQNIFSSNGFLTIVDESHMSVPQVRGMYFGDQSRKENLIKYGFRLPSALDNRPLKFNEFLAKNQQFVFVSATPAPWELEYSQQRVVEQLLRPTGLVDPKVDIRPSEGQIEDLIKEVLHRKVRGERVLITVLTKRLAETLTDYLNDDQRLWQFIREHDLPEISTLAQTNKFTLPQVAYLHSDVETLERSNILADLREGKYDVLVGINLLREGLDLPEVSLVAIVDADKEGFLRSETSLIQTIGRAARHLHGQAIMYADTITGSMKRALAETSRRRRYQLQYNQDHHITPATINKMIRQRLLESTPETGETNQAEPSLRQQKVTGGRKLWGEGKTQGRKKPLILNLDKKIAVDLNNFDPGNYTPYEKKVLNRKLARKMSAAAKEMDFELAAIIRDTIKLIA